MKTENPKTRVALLCGGDSSEREVSLKTSMSMCDAISAERFDVTVFDVNSHAQDGLLRIDTARISDIEHSVLGDWWNEDGQKRRLVSWENLTGELKSGGFDVVLSGLHGGWGEDGTIQALLDVARIPYVGSPQRSSVVAIDKQMCKAVMRDIGITSARGVLMTQATSEPPFPGPIVVKPNGGGSSVGVALLRTEGDLASWPQAISAALSDGSGALVEEMIEGTELTIGVLGEGDNARVLPMVEIVPQKGGGFYDYEAKYAAGGSQHLIPPRLPEAVLNNVADCALKAHRHLGCRGVSRSDYIVTQDGTPYFLEVNTLPGMTKTSLVPEMAHAVGIEFDQLLETLIEEALRRAS